MKLSPARALLFLTPWLCGGAARAQTLTAQWLSPDATGPAGGAVLAPVALDGGRLVVLKNIQNAEASFRLELLDAASGSPLAAHSLGIDDAVSEADLGVHEGFAVVALSLFDLHFPNNYEAVLLVDLATGELGFPVFTLEHQIGGSVDLDDDWIVAANLYAGPEMGIVFDRASESFAHTLDSELNPGAFFYESELAVSGGRVIIGDAGDDIAAVDAGACDVFDAATGDWLGRLEPAAPAAGARFGSAVALEGAAAAVGAPGAAGGDGAVHVFDAATRTELYAVGDPVAGAARGFGSEVAIDGGVLLVGTAGDVGVPGTAFAFDLATGALFAELAQPTLPAAGPYAVEVALEGGVAATTGAALAVPGAEYGGAAFVHDAASGALVQTVGGGDSEVFDEFGTTVDVDGPLAVVGAPRDGDGGSVTVVDVATGVALVELQHPYPEETSGSTNMSMAISGDRVLVGDGQLDEQTGRAWVFDATTGQVLFELAASNAEPGARFGSGVDVDGTLAVVGATGHGPIDSGLAYVFDVTNGEELRMLSTDDPGPDDFFGFGIALWQGYVLIGASGKDDFTGAAYVFDVATGEQLAKLTDPDGGPDDRFGHALDLDAGRALISSSYFTSPGKVHVFDALAGVELFQIPNPGFYDAFGTELDLAWGDGEHTAVVRATFGAATRMYVFDAATGAAAGEVTVIEPDPLLGKFASLGGLAADGGKLFMGLPYGNYVNVYDDPVAPAPLVYCVAKESSAGCAAGIGTSSGALPVSGTGGYAVTASQVQGQKTGLVFASLFGPAATPFGGGTLCVTPPLKRGPLSSSGGSSGVCNGSFDVIVNDGAVVPLGLDAGPGVTASYQWWYRDPANGPGVLGTALSNALELAFL